MICDVAKYQGIIDWGRLASILDFVVIKASGKTKDPQFDRNAAEATRLGVPFHVYHFLYCTTEVRAKVEAKMFSDAVGEYRPLFWVLDCEKASGITAKKARTIVEAFEAELKRLRGNDIQVAVYIANELYKSWNLDYSRYAYVWIPRYGKNNGTIEGSIRPTHLCDLWQYTSKGKLPGISGDVDLDTLTGTKPMSFFTGKTSTTDQETQGGVEMTKRMPIGQFVAELKAALDRGDGYIMGSYGQNPRTGYLDLSVPESKCKSSWKPDGYYYTQYSGSQRTQALKWRKNCTRVWDCNGMAEGIYEIYSGTCINSKARHNYSGWCGVKGSGMIPTKYRVPGAAVFWSNSGASSIHHVAYLWKPVTDGKPEGDWYIIEAKGVMYGVVKSKLNSRKPNYWGLMDKYFDYGDNAEYKPSETPVVIAPTLGSRILRNGDEGADVKEMQAGLIRLGYDLGKWGADGDFGDATEEAVKAFQKDHDLEVDGEFGPKSLAAFEKALAVLDKPVEAPKYVRIVGGNCYVRTAPNTSGKALGVAHEGDELPYGGMIDEDTKWLLVEYKGQNAWVSGKYGRLV